MSRIIVGKYRDRLLTRSPHSKKHRGSGNFATSQALKLWNAHSLPEQERTDAGFKFDRVQRGVAGPDKPHRRNGATLLAVFADFARLIARRLRARPSAGGGGSPSPPS